jgi:hypothetical protein
LSLPIFYNTTNPDEEDMNYGFKIALWRGVGAGVYIGEKE